MLNPTSNHNPKIFLMKTILIFLFALLFLANAKTVEAQDAKSYIKSGDAFVKIQNYGDGISSYTKAIEIDPQNALAYSKRAAAYEALNKAESAVEDYVRASALDPKEVSNFYSASRIYYDLGKYEQSLKCATDALTKEPKHLDALNLKIKGLIAIEMYDEANEYADKALDVKKNYQTFYNKGLILYLKKDYVGSIEYYKKSVDKDDKIAEVFIGLANTYFEQNNLVEALIAADKAILNDDKSMEAYFSRARIYHKQIEYQKAINDLSKVIVLYPNHIKTKQVYALRGKYYLEFNQHMNAINDFTQVVKIDPLNVEAYFNRAECYEAIHNYDGAVKDYEYISTIKLKDYKYMEILENANARLFELKREYDKPVITFDKPVTKSDSELEVVKGEKQLEVRGGIKDASKIKTLEINGNRIVFDDSNPKNEFSAVVSVDGVENVVFKVVDVYDNTLDKNYKLVFTEINQPLLSLVSPIPSDDGQIYLESESTSLYIEGNIIDESIIASIQIDGINASYAPDVINPAFSATIAITNKSKIKVEVKDIYGNTTLKEFVLNRESAQINAENPMGKTWVIFIENSKYQSFASLNGPTMDVAMMKSALNKYQIHNIIHKRDMSKSQMDRFFSIELRDMIKKNHVNSIVVWYAGHGKFLNNTGYWIPIDAKRDEEFTYFNISSLKASMQAYSSDITHTLVITDACESGPTFYQAMRANPVIRDCGDWKATKFKSSQVFSSAGYELASDNSQFTKTFANTLISNPDQCIPIESIVFKVTDAVAKNKQQKPQFGKIDGLTDEDGTFFFIKK